MCKQIQVHPARLSMEEYFCAIEAKEQIVISSVITNFFMLEIYLQELIRENKFITSLSYEYIYYSSCWCKDLLMSFSYPEQQNGIKSNFNILLLLVS